MEIQQQAYGAVTVLKPMGPLVDKDAAQFRSCALDHSGRTLGRIVVDASSVTYLDSLGIEALVDVTEEMSASGRALKLCCPNATLRQVLDLTGWEEAFEYFEDVNSGVRSFL